MKERCILAVSNAVGRSITQEEAKGIEERILRNMRAAARLDPKGFQSLTPDQRLQSAAQFAAKELVEEAEKEKQRVALTIQAHDRISNYISDQAAKGMDGLESLHRTLTPKYDAKSNTISSYTRAQAIRNDTIRLLQDTITAIDPKIFGLLEDMEGVKQLTKAIFGEITGDAKIDAGGKAWGEVATKLREQFNNAGGVIRKLEDWRLPQHHSQIKILKSGQTQWVIDTLPLLKRERYTNDDGSLMNEQQLTEVLKSAWDTLATGGLNKQEFMGAAGSSMMANWNAEARSIHFKDADSYLAYQSKYGDKSLWGVITGHVENMSKEIAMLETYGPNPDNMFKRMLFNERQKAIDLDKTKAGDYAKQAEYLESLFDYVAGKTQPIANKTIAQGFDSLRSWLSASKLGSAVITAMADEATVHLTANINKLPAVQLIQNELAAFNLANQSEKELAHRAGLALDTLLGELNRWGQDNLGHGVANKAATSVMRLSGMDALDGARRRAFGVTYMSALGEMAGKYDSLSKISQSDYRILLSKGITDTDWGIWRLADLEKWGAGNGVLTPDAIYKVSDRKIIDAGLVAADAPEGAIAAARREAALRLLGVIGEETDMAVIRPGAEEKFFTGGSSDRGSWKGELTRSFFLFKSFPITMINRHWIQRGMNEPTMMGKAAYIGKLIAGTTILGAVSQTVNDLVSGKNPREYYGDDTSVVTRNWIAAFLKGGSMGIYGDFLFSEATQHSQTGVIGTTLGPVAGLVEEAMGLTQGNIIQALQGKDTNFGAELTRFIKGNLPGASIWYAKAALDHLIFQQLQEYFSPGYLGRMRRRAMKEFGQSYFWQPGDGFGDIETPDLAKAIGQ